MKIKAVLDSLDGLDASLHGLYQQAADGKYYLDAEGVDDLPAVKGLRTKRDELLATNRKLKEKAGQFEGIEDPEKAKKLIEIFGDRDPDEIREFVEKAAEGGGDKEGVESLKAALQKQHQREIERLRGEYQKTTEKLQQENARLKGHIELTELDRGLDAALAKVGVIEATREAVKALLRTKYQPKVVEDDGDGYRAIFSTDVGDVSVLDFVKSWSTTDEASPFMPASGNNGSGAGSGSSTPGGRKNPWRKETFNLTEQGKLVKENPALAKQLAAAAGVTLNI